MAAGPGQRSGLLCCRSSFPGGTQGQPRAALLFGRLPGQGNTLGCACLPAVLPPVFGWGTEGWCHCRQTPLGAPCLAAAACSAFSRWASVLPAGCNQHHCAMRCPKPGDGGALPGPKAAAAARCLHQAGVSPAAMPGGASLVLGGHCMGLGATELMAVLSPQAGPACTTKPPCALSRSAPRTRAGTSAKCSCWTSSTTPSTTAAGSTSRSTVRWVWWGQHRWGGRGAAASPGGCMWCRCRDRFPFDF